MATPTSCTIYTTEAHFFPWNATLAEQDSSQIFSLDSGPHGSPCPGQVRPFNPTPRRRHLEPRGRRLLRLHPASSTAKTATSSSATSTSRCRPGLTANLRGITYCPEAAIAAAADNAGRTEQATPSCPAELADRHLERRRRARAPTPSTRSARSTSPGPFKGAPLSLVAITPALAGPYDYGTVVVRVALHIDPLDAHVVADSETVP